MCVGISAFLERPIDHVSAGLDDESQLTSLPG